MEGNKLNGNKFFLEYSFLKLVYKNQCLVSLFLFLKKKFHKKKKVLSKFQKIFFLKKGLVSFIKLSIVLKLLAF